MRTAGELLRALETPQGERRLAELYGHRADGLSRQRERYARLLARHAQAFGAGRGTMALSAPGRTEICGNHTDHNRGLVMAAAVDLDTVAAVSPREDGRVRLHSEGFAPVELDLSDLAPQAREQGTPASIIRGVARRLSDMGLSVRGFDGCACSSVLTGSGLSSSAAFEVLTVAVFDALYNGLQVSPIERAKVSQYAENEYFGKPCGLMDQMASSVGGLVAIDFEGEPRVTPLQLALDGYSLVVVDTGGSHDDLTEDYAAIRREMSAVAACFGKDALRFAPQDRFFAELPRVREACGERAALRALHFYGENARVERLIEAVRAQDVEAFRQILIASGRSSWMYLQNVYARPDAQPLCLALAVAERLLSGEGAWRVHGGGFAGTTLNLVPSALEPQFLGTMRALFGEKSCHVLSIRREGAAIVLQ